MLQIIDTFKRQQVLACPERRPYSPLLHLRLWLSMFAIQAGSSKYVRPHLKLSFVPYNLLDFFILSVLVSSLTLFHASATLLKYLFMFIVSWFLLSFLLCPHIDPAFPVLKNCCMSSSSNSSGALCYYHVSLLPSFFWVMWCRMWYPALWPSQTTINKKPPQARGKRKRQALMTT